jgi:hypothetical protein
MAKHTLEVSLPSVEIHNADLAVIVRAERKIGTLKISKGSIEWLPVGFSSGFHLSWTQFDDLMREYGKKR